MGAAQPGTGTATTAGRVVEVALALALVAGVLLAAPPGAATAQASGPFDGDPATTERLHALDAVGAGVELSRVRFPTGGAAHVVISRDDDFPDSLAGSALTGRGPLLLTGSGELVGRTRDELRRVLPAGGTVYLLGGTAALSRAVADAVAADGYVVRRLGGQERIATALAVADEVARLAGGTPRVLLARSEGTATDRSAGWADSVTAGGVAARDTTPVLLTPTSHLDDRVAAWMAARGVGETVLLGGTAALSTAVERRVPGPRRIAGAERTATAAAVARSLWPTRTRLTVTSARHPAGWAFGLAAGGLAGDAGAPLLLVESGVGPAVRALVSSCGVPGIDQVVVGDGSVVSGAVREALDAYDGRACGPSGGLQVAPTLAAAATCDDLLAGFRAAALEQVGPFGLGSGPAGGGSPMPMPAAPTAGAGGVPRSGTNVQEAGVDEPDLVKDDGRLAVAVAQGRLQVVDLTGTAPRLVGTLDLEPGVHELLLSGATAVVLSTSWGSREVSGADGSGAFAPTAPTTTVRLVDLTDPSRPAVRSAFEVDGYRRGARLVGSTVRLVVQSTPALAFTAPQEPTEDAVAEAAEANRRIVAQAPLSAWVPQLRDEGGQRPLLGCGAIARPPWQDGVDVLAVVTFDATDGRVTSGAGVVARGDLVYASPTTLVVSTSRWGARQPLLVGEPVTTELHAFSIADPAATRYVASGAVPGYLLNQFAVSEHGERIRVATTSAPPWRADPALQSSSAVRVLEARDGALVPVGVVDGLGRGERIFAVRFLGDLAAVVTFRQVDPLYLVDLSDPTAPRVTGELKIPGYSAYLHRVGEDRLLGVGQEATDEGRPTGLQVSLFDISDRTAPRRVAQVVYPGAASEVEHDHRAFLFWEPTGLAVVPRQRVGTRGDVTADAVGLGVDPASLSERGVATHADSAPAGQAGAGAIRRAFVVGDRLYTVSAVGIEAGRLTDLGPLGFAAFR